MSTIALGHFSGSYYEIGVKQGKTIRTLLHRGLKEIPNYDEIKLMKPRFVPTSLFLRMAKRRATNLLKDAVFQFYPKQAQRMEGIAEGAGVDISTLFFIQSMELIITVGPSSYQALACTAIGFNSRRTTTREIIIGKNFDYPNHQKPYQMTYQVDPGERYKTLGCTMAPLAGMLDGMNEHGLAVTYNLGYGTEEPKHFAPLSLALQEMLETCTNTAEAVEFITHAKRAGNALLMIADPDDNIKTVEISHNHAEIREPTDDQIINTNHYHTPEMQRYEIPRNALFFGKVAETFNLQGIRVHESSEQRLLRAQELCNTETKIDEARITSILRDHGKNNQPSNLTICQHGPQVSTIRSVLLYPSQRTIKVLYGNLCQNEYSEFKLV